MSFLETVRSVVTYLKDHGRVSLRALKLEYGLDDQSLELLIEELVDVIQVATLEDKFLTWNNRQGPEPSSNVDTAKPKSGTALEAISEPDRHFDDTDGERRQLTVLYCDLVDSVKLASELDPEDWRNIVRQYQHCATSAIENLDGFVAQYLGDGILVYFGYPHAHEDDPERAVRAGLSIIEELERTIKKTCGTEYAVRIGIHTGPVVISEMGGGARREILALGDTTNVAARLQAEAAPDTVVLSSATLRLVQGIFRTEDMGDRYLKGLPEPVHVHRALRTIGMSSALDIESVSGVTPLVGRQQELGLLEDRWAQVQDGWGQAVLISGDVGIGKSRLVQAFREAQAERAHTWLECRCSPYTQESSLYPVRELQLRALRLKPEDPVSAKIEGLEAGITAAGLDLEKTLPLMAAFQSIPVPGGKTLEMSPEFVRKQTLELLVEWLLRLGREQPVILLMEDLHWMDPSSKELITGMLDQIARAPVLLLLTYRPDCEPFWDAGSHVTPILLTRLIGKQIGELIHRAAGERRVPDSWVTEITRRADGVPLFAEELTRAVIELNPESPKSNATPELHIPETLQDSLMARLDALGPGKQIAQIASVLGREFSYQLLRSVSPIKQDLFHELLAHAVREELFYQRGLPPDASYLFKHTLIRDVAYQSMLRSTRQKQHLRVANAIITQMPEVLEMQPELVAYHLAEAGDKRAIDYWELAGQRANSHVAHEEAISHLGRGLELLEHEPAGPERAKQELGLLIPLGQALLAARGFGHDEALDVWRRALAICDPAVDPKAASVIYFGLTVEHISHGKADLAIESCDQLRNIGEHAGETVRVAADYLSGIALWAQGRFVDSRNQFESVISQYDPNALHQLLAERSMELGVGAHSYAAWTYWYLGYPDRATTIMEQVLRCARESDHPFRIATASAWASILALFRNEWPHAQALSLEAAQLSHDHGLPFFEALASLVQILTSNAKDADALAAYLAAMQRAAKTGNQIGTPLIMGWLAELQLNAGDADAALSTVEKAIAVSYETGQRYQESALYRRKGEILLHVTDQGHIAAEPMFQRALQIARDQSAKPLELRAAISLARLWRQDGRGAEIRPLLEPVYDWFTEGLELEDLQDAHSLLEAT
jgi:class 3 adenylate cyclase/tetratricopeptide (TPR) repeat protein